MEGKVAVLGDADFVMPFSALGFDTFAVSQEAEEILENARQILEKKYALVVVAENVAEKAEEVFVDIQLSPIPSIVVVPFTTEPEGFAIRALGKSFKLATGIDILQNN